MKVIGLWGRPCSGKTTIAIRLREKLLNTGAFVSVLDGDVIRSSSNHQDFSKKGRGKQIKKVQKTLRDGQVGDDFVIVSLVTPFKNMRLNNREVIRNYYEVHVDVDLDTAIKRDVKGMYEKALNGEINNFTGIDDPFEEDNTADLTVDTKDESIEESVEKIFKYI